MTTPYLYIIRNKKTQEWYIGSRTAYGCHPNDGYMSSSNHIKALYKKNPEELEKEVIITGTVQEILELETAILQALDAKNDEDSYNDHNNQGFELNPRKHAIDQFFKNKEKNDK